MVFQCVYQDRKGQTLPAGCLVVIIATIICFIPEYSTTSTKHWLSAPACLPGCVPQPSASAAAVPTGDAGRTCRGPGTTSSLFWPQLSAQGLSHLATTVALLTDPHQTVWFPMYGCALLALPIADPAARAAEDAPSASAADDDDEEADIRARLPEVTVLLVGLDDWSFRMHKCVGSTLGEGGDSVWQRRFSQVFSLFTLRGILSAVRYCWCCTHQRSLSA